MLVVDRRSWAGEIEDLVNIDVERETHVVPHELESSMAREMVKIAPVTRKQVVDAQDLIAACEQTID